MSARDLITEHLDLWTGAVMKKSSSGRGSNGKVELTGVKKLRELILELAVRGKLAEQIAGDVAAQELIEGISDLRQQKICEGALPKFKTFKLDTEHVPEYDVPNLWALAPLGHLTLQITDGVHHTPNYLPSGVPFISVKDIDGRNVSFRDCKYISEEQHKEINKRCNPEQGDILLCRIGTLGRATIVDTDVPFSLFVSVGLLKMPTTLISSRYVHLALHSPFVLQQMDQIKAGGSHTNKLNLAAIPTLHIPVPPLEEQHRIVQKVDELMALCDRLEQQASDQLEAHETLVDTLLGTLTQSENATELTDNWARLAAHFDTLFTTEQSIDKLKRTILQLAVMGRLVEQDAGDESAFLLLNKLNERRQQLLAEKKVRAAKKIEPVADEELPFQLPSGWVWCRFEQLIDPEYTISYGVLVPGANSHDGVPLIRVADLSIAPQQKLPEKKVSHEVDSKHSKTKLVGGEILLCVVGSIGKIGMAPSSWKGANIARAICRLMPSSFISKDFLLLLMQTDFMQKKFGADTRTLAQPTLNVGLIKVAETPLPPIEEQHRIVQKVDELMSLCDQLKERLNNAGETRCQLAVTVVEKALG